MFSIFTNTFSKQIFITIGQNDLTFPSGINYIEPNSVYENITFRTLRSAISLGMWVVFTHQILENVSLCTAYVECNLDCHPVYNSITCNSRTHVYDL